MPNTFNDAIGGNENSFAGPESVHGHNLVGIMDTDFFAMRRSATFVTAIRSTTCRYSLLR